MLRPRITERPVLYRHRHCVACCHLEVVECTRRPSGISEPNWESGNGISTAHSGKNIKGNLHDYLKDNARYLKDSELFFFYMAAFLILLQIAWQLWSHFFSSKFKIASKAVAQLWRKHFGSCSVQYWHSTLQSLQIVPIGISDFVHVIKGAATKFCLGDRFMINQIQLPQFFILGFRPLYFENVGKCKKSVQKKVWNILFLEEVPRWFCNWGTRPPSPRFRRHSYHWPQFRSISWPANYKSLKG